MKTAIVVMLSSLMLAGVVETHQALRHGWSRDSSALKAEYRKKLGALAKKHAARAASEKRKLARRGELQQAATVERFERELEALAAAGARQQNLMVAAVVEASSRCGARKNEAAALNVKDGRAGTAWVPDFRQASHWLRINLRAERRIARVAILVPIDARHEIWSYTLTLLSANHERIYMRRVSRGQHPRLELADDKAHWVVFDWLEPIAASRVELRCQTADPRFVPKIYEVRVEGS